MSESLADGPDELPNQLSGVDQRVAQELRQRNRSLWRSNYHEASIYIEEGLNNDKFENHPKKRIRKAITTASPQNASLIGSPGHPLQAQDESTLPKKPFINSSSSNNQLRNNDNLIIDQEKEPHGFILGGQYTTIETYILVHNRYFYQLDLSASIILLMLALVEPPAVDGYELNPKIHAAIEMFALGIIAIELLLKFRWMGPGRFFRHGRTVTKLAVLLLMNLEAIVIFLRHSTHARYSRALRPIFLIDNHYCHGLRRAVRQIFQSLPPIIDMFTLALFFMFIFSIFGFYLFASNNYYFSDMPATIGNLLILATTANLPDVMMPSYAVTRWSAIFFVLFVIIHLFLFTNLTMAAVYEIFTRKEKEKFHKLLLHRRKACQEAFKLLVSRRQPNRIQYRQFMGLMRYLNRKCSMFDAYLIFKALDTDKNGSISLSEFYQIYDFINLEWKLIYPKFKWYDDYVCLRCMPLCRRLLYAIERIVNRRLFEWTIDLLIAGQAGLQFLEATAFGDTAQPMPSQMIIPQSSNNTITNQTMTIQTSMDTNNNNNLQEIYPDRVSTHIFISVFLAEALLRCLANGPREYWRNRWNRFDLIVLFISLVGLLNGPLFGGQPFGWVIVLRVLRLMRLFEFKRRYRDMWQTLTYILLKRFVSMTCVVMILYYFFAIIGMELLSDYDLKNCCQNTTIESQFKFDANSSTLDNGLIRYYLNDFGDLVASYLTLFSMSSNTYWLTLMNAYTIVSGTNWVRLFFGLYYLCSIIVMNIVIAFILESFLFHIHYRNKMGDNCDDTNLFTVSVTLSSFEVDFLRQTLGSSSSLSTTNSSLANPTDSNNSRSCVKELDEIVAKLHRANEDSKFLSHSSTSSTNSSSALLTKIISDDYNELINADTMMYEEQATETTCLLKGSKAGNKVHTILQRKKHSSISKQSPLILQLQPKTPNSKDNNNIANNNNDSKSTNKQQQQQQNTIPSTRHSSTTPSPPPPQLPPPPLGAPSGSSMESPRRPEYYLIYQAEQIRNKFSFTMKMYADEVESWLAEAERADQDALSLMISRNQVRAEHVAMARLARRSHANELQHNHRLASGITTDDLNRINHEIDTSQMHAGDSSGAGTPRARAGPLNNVLLAEYFRPRSYSSSAGALNISKQHKTTNNDDDRAS